MSRLSLSDSPTDVLLFGQIVTYEQEKVDDKQDKYTLIQNTICKQTFLQLTILGFNETVIMEGNQFFRVIDSHAKNFSDKNLDLIRGMINSYSQFQFLGFCSLEQNRILELNDQEKQRASFLQQILNMDHIYFGIFSMSSINLPGNIPEQGQNFDSNNIIRYQYRMFEVNSQFDRKGDLNIKAIPVKLSILNLVNTQTIENSQPMQGYQFVNKSVISQMDTIAVSIKKEINSLSNKREKYFDQIRMNEKEYAQLLQQNKQLRDKFGLLNQEISELMSVNQI
eukprot:403368894